MEVPTRIELDGGVRLTLTWADGSVSEFEATELRKACPCASCEGSAGGWVFPNVTIDRIEQAGAYGLRLSFAPEGHEAGIYTYEYLRSLGR